MSTSVQSDALIVELSDNAMSAAQGLDVGLECSHFGVGERAILDLADPRLADVPPLRQRLDGCRLRTHVQRRHDNGRIHRPLA